MKHYVQLKDGIVFNYHQSPEGVDDSGPNVWEVEEEASDKLGMKYDTDTKVFSEAELIKYAILNEENIVIIINETKFSSEVGNNVIITNDQVQPLWQWDGTTFIDLIEKNNLEENERYVKSLEDLAAEAEALASAEPAPVEEVEVPDTSYKLTADGVEHSFATQAEMEAFVANLEHENELRMQQLLESGIVVEEE
jgi:hypothetical protein